MLDNDSRKESGSETYYERKCDALFDIDGRGNTERLVARNPKLKNLLKDGEYIPSLGQLNLMAHYMDELNKAFAYVSASPPPPPRRGIDPVPRAARASRGTWTSPLVARTTVTSTTVAEFGR